ncbi:hypothetical protein [Lacinutrix sp. MEBiC02595]
MKVKISKFQNTGITEADFHFSLEHKLSSIKEQINLESDSFCSYELDRGKSSKDKLVFRNVNHLKMLHKYLISSYFYVALIAFPVLVVLHESSKDVDSDGNLTSNFIYILISLAFLFGTFKGLKVPYRIVIDHLTISEQNLFTRKVDVFFPKRILTTNVNEIDFVVISSEEQSLFIMENEQFEVIEFLKNYLKKFRFESHL